MAFTPNLLCVVCQRKKPASQVKALSTAGGIRLGNICKQCEKRLEEDDAAPNQ